MERILWISVIATIVWAVSMAIEAARFDRSRRSGSIGRFDSPIAMLELANSQRAFSAVLDQGQRQNNIRTMRINTYMDFVFVLLYSSTSILLATVCCRESILSVTVAIAVTATGVLDYWENFRLLGLFKIMQSTAVTEAPLSRPVSLAKWGLFAADLALVGSAILQATARTASPLLIVMAVFVFLAASCAAVGLFRNGLIGISVLGLFPALLIAAWIWRP